MTIRFRRGLYEYLTVIECKDYEKPVPVEKVEAFVTKSSDVKAHYAVMASASGFQEGAQRVAIKHNMTLIHVTDSSDIDLSVFGAQWGGTTDAFHVESVELEYADGERKQLPAASNAMTYYVNQILLQCGPERGSLNDLIQHHTHPFPGGEIDVYRNHAIPCSSGTRVIGPEDGEIPLKPLACVHVRVGMTKAKVITGPAMVDPYLLVPDVKVRNVGTGDQRMFRQRDLEFGVNNVFAAGQFYEQPQMASYYYCDSVNDDLAHLYLVESFQHGHLLQAEFTVKTEFATRYIPVSDKVVIERLQRRLDRLKNNQAAR